MQYRQKKPISKPLITYAGNSLKNIWKWVKQITNDFNPNDDLVIASYYDYKREYYTQCAGLIQYIELFYPDISYSNIFANVYNDWYYKFCKVQGK